ncbi:MAG: two-component system sensor histidine kinase NtrB [Chitinophagales bacterium]
MSLAASYSTGGPIVLVLFAGLSAITYEALASSILRIKNRDLATRYSDSQAYLRDLVAGMLNGVLAVDTEARVTMVNRSAEALLGRAASATVDRPVSSLGEDQLTEMLERALASGDGGPTKELVLGGSERTTEVLCSVSALRDAGGRVTGSVAVLQDITEQKQIERRLSHLDRLALLGEFAAGVVHEINNPLAMVTMALDNAAQGLAEGESDLAIEDIALARRNVGRLEKLSRQLLSFSRPVPAELGLVDVGRALDEVLNIVAPQARTIRVRVQRQISDDLMLVAEDSVLQQVFLNLAANAMQAMPDGGELTVAAGKMVTSVRDLEAARVVAAGAAEAGRWERSVRVLGPMISPEADAERREYIWVGFTDTGVGMSRESLEMVGRTFFTTKEKGTGLGIAVVSKLLAQYRGVLEIKSRPGAGSSFCLWFPVLTAAELRDAATVTGTGIYDSQVAEDGAGFRVAEGRGLFQLADAAKEAACASE